MKPQALGVIYVRHGMIKVWAWNGAYVLCWHITPPYKERHAIEIVAESKLERDEFITRIRKYADMIE